MLSKKVAVLLIPLAALLCTGCTAKAEISKEDLNKVKTCTDTRDGEVFSFNTNTVTNVRVGYGAPSTFDMVTTDGDKMTISSDAAVLFLKCKDSTPS